MQTFYNDQNKCLEVYGTSSAYAVSNIEKHVVDKFNLDYGAVVSEIFDEDRDFQAWTIEIYVTELVSKSIVTSLQNNRLI